MKHSRAYNLSERKNPLARCALEERLSGSPQFEQPSPGGSVRWMLLESNASTDGNRFLVAGRGILELALLLINVSQDIQAIKNLEMVDTQDLCGECNSPMGVL